MTDGCDRTWFVKRFSFSHGDFLAFTARPDDVLIVAFRNIFSTVDRPQDERLHFDKGWRPLDRVSVLLAHSSIRITERHYAPWTRSRQDQIEADLRPLGAMIPLCSPTGRAHQSCREKRVRSTDCGAAGRSKYCFRVAVYYRTETSGMTRFSRLP
jgi:hypothetical protein